MFEGLGSKPCPVTLLLLELPKADLGNLQRQPCHVNFCFDLKIEIPSFQSSRLKTKFRL